VLEWKPSGRTRTRPRKWIGDIEDIESMAIRGWRKLKKE
jgi:hypothetical protein